MEGEHEAAAKLSMLLRRSEEIIPLPQSIFTLNLASSFDNSRPINPNSTPSLNPTPFKLSWPNYQSKTRADNDSDDRNNSCVDKLLRPKKKRRTVWTVKLHKKFVDAIGHLGLKNAVPKAIVKMMNVDGLTRDCVASHLQSYRSYLKSKEKKNDTSSARGVEGSSTRLLSHDVIPATVAAHTAAAQQQRYQLMNIGQFLGNTDAGYPGFFNIGAPIIVPPIRIAPPTKKKNGASSVGGVEGSSTHLLSNDVIQATVAAHTAAAQRERYQLMNMGQFLGNRGAYYPGFFRMAHPKMDNSAFQGDLFNDRAPRMEPSKMDNSAFHGGFFNIGAPTMAAPIWMARPISMRPPKAGPVLYLDDLEERREEGCEGSKGLPFSPKGKD